MCRVCRISYGDADGRPGVFECRSDGDFVGPPIRPITFAEMSRYAKIAERLWDEILNKKGPDDPGLRS